MMNQPSTAPSGALCARHGDRAASLVCVRCGNFMCAECSEGGAQAQCPGCRALTGGDAFPYRRDDYDFGRLWAHAFEAFSREWVLLSVGALILFALTMAGSLVANVINTVLTSMLGLAAGDSGRGGLVMLGVSFVTGQVIGTLVNMAIQGVALVGFYRMVIDVLLGRRADLARMFSQLKKLPTYVITQLILLVIVTLPTLLYFAGVAVAALAAVGVKLSHLESTNWERLFDGPAVLIVLIGTLGYVAFSAVVLLPLTLFVVPEIVVSDAPALEVIRRAWRLASGHRLPLFGYSFVMGLLIALGMILCLLPVLPALAMGTSLLLALFLALRNGSGLPAADHS